MLMAAAPVADLRLQLAAWVGLGEMRTMCQCWKCPIVDSSRVNCRHAGHPSVSYRCIGRAGQDI